MPVFRNSPLPMWQMRNRLGSGLRHERFRLIALKLGILMIPRLPDVKPPCLTRPENLAFSGLLFASMRSSRVAWGLCGATSPLLPATNRRPASDALLRLQRSRGDEQRPDEHRGMIDDRRSALEVERPTYRRPTAELDG